MALNLTWGGNSIGYPQPNDQGWGLEATATIVAINQYCIQSSGGTYALTANLNLGSNFGLIGKSFTSITTNPGTGGVLNLAKTDGINWRNNANSANLALAIDGSDNLTYNGNIVITATSNYVIGPNSSTDKAIATFNGASGTSIQNNSSAKINTGGTITAPAFSGTNGTFTNGTFTNGTITTGTIGSAIIQNGTIGTSLGVGALGSNNGLYVTSSGWIGIGTNSPSTQIHVNQTGTSGFAALTIQGENQTTIQQLNYGTLTGNVNGFYKARGTIASPSNIGSGDIIGITDYIGYAGQFGISAAIGVNVDGTVATPGGTASVPGRIYFQTTPAGSTAVVTGVQIRNTGGLQLGGPSGSTAVYGGCNAQDGYYVNGSKLPVSTAVQADMEGDSSTTAAVVPGVMKYGVGVAKAWALIGMTGSSAAAAASYNVSSVVRNSTGNITINMTTGFSSSNWVPNMTGGIDIGGSITTYASLLSRTGSSVNCLFVDASNTARDVGICSFTGFGDF